MSSLPAAAMRRDEAARPAPRREATAPTRMPPSRRASPRRRRARGPPRRARRAPLSPPPHGRNDGRRRRAPRRVAVPTTALDRAARGRRRPSIARRAARAAPAVATPARDATA